MDWLKVAAATGAGYASKYMQNFSRDNKGLSGLPSGSSIVEKPPEMRGKNSSLQKSAGREQQPCFDGGNRTPSDGSSQERMPCESPLATEMASASRFEGDCCDNSNNMGEVSAFEMGAVRSPIRGKSYLRSRRSNLHHLKPLSSIESCLLAQLYRKHDGMEEHLVVPFPSLCTPAFRTFLVTDGTQIISPSCDLLNLQVRDGKDKARIQVYPEVNEAVFGGIPRIPLIRPLEGSRERNLKKRKDENNKVSSSRGMPNEMEISSQGLPNGAVLFCLGVSVGIISNILANKAEVTKLHDLLKQTENLVQDLQEELEMKDSITVKELVNEDNVFPLANENSADIEKPIKALVHTDSDVLTRYSVEATCTHKSAETVESMSIIEAELEAELERLELNMKKSALPGLLSDDDELDPDLVADVVQGELRADMFSINPSSGPSRDHCSSSVSPPCSKKQAVSPQELSLLSLRLHQVIQSRLEQRITELEAALEKSQKRIMQFQSEQRLSSRRGFSYTDMPSSSSSVSSSPVTTGSNTPVEAQGEPLIINLSGEALEAYSEAFKELKNINGSKNEVHSYATYKVSEGERIIRKSLRSKQNGTEDGLFLFGPAAVDPHISETGRRMIEQLHRLPMDESKDEDEDMALLIKQIVEKTRQGSPAILDAHKAMVSLDKNEE